MQGVRRNTPKTATYIFYIVDIDMIKDRTDYQEHDASLWATNVPVNALDKMRTNRSRAECNDY